MPADGETPPRYHSCRPPVVTATDRPGRAWRCDECGTRFVLLLVRRHACSAGQFSGPRERFHWCSDVRR